MTPALTIGASDVPVILGLSPYRDASAFAIWARLRGHPTNRPDNTAAQARGHMMEPGVLLRIGAETGLWVQPNSARLYPRGDDPRWRHSTPDGLLFRDGELVAGAEAKALRFLDGWGEPGTDQVREDYLTQVVWQNITASLDRTFVGAYGTYHDEWRLYEVGRKADVERTITEAVRSWWDRHVVADDPPPMDDTPAAARALSGVYRDVTGDRKQATPTDLELVRQLRAVDEHIAEVRSKRQRMRNTLQASMEGHTHLLHGSKVIARCSRPSNDTGSRRLTVIRERDE